MDNRSLNYLITHDSQRENSMRERFCNSLYFQNHAGFDVKSEAVQQHILNAIYSGISINK
jgi:hypothetical protein